MKKIAVILMACLALVATAQAERYLIDVGDSTTPTAGNWNNFTVATGSSGWGATGDNKFVQEAANMVDSTGVVHNGVSFGISNIDDIRASGGSAATWTVAGITYPATAASDFVQTTQIGDATGPFVNGGENGTYNEHIIISGLTSAAYNVTLLGGRDGQTPGSRLGYFRIIGAGTSAIVANDAAVPGLVNFAAQVPGTVSITGPGGTLTFNNALMVDFWGDSVAGTTDLNVVDLNATPEPATMGLLAIGALMALKRRRA